MVDHILTSPRLLRSLHLANNYYKYSKPIYGLIFLFRWREDDPDKQEAICPERLWFANQVCLQSRLGRLDGFLAHFLA